jgi:TRAP-type uncharacterized transport system substrate-binding protein
MKTSFKYLSVLILASTLSLAAHAQFRVATGAADGTYSAMFKQLAKMCGNEVGMVEVNSSGSNENVDLLVGNQVNAAFVQSDVLFFRARTEELGNVKTLLALHPEEVHFLTTAVSKEKTGGVMGFGGKTVQMNTIADLAGRRVAASGGSFTTAQVVRLQSEINATIVQMADMKQMLAALAAGDIQAIVAVGGSPLPSLAALGPDFKLLGVPEAVQTKLKGVYRPARVSYSKMGAAGVSTVATDALFVSREYKTPRMIEQLSKFRRCAEAAIPELKETIGTHPKWQAVDTNNKGKWAYYDLPAAK